MSEHFIYTNMIVVKKTSNNRDGKVVEKNEFLVKNNHVKQ